MTISVTDNSITYVGDDSTTTFAFPYTLYAVSHLEVYLNNVLQSTLYSVSGIGTSNVNVIFINPPANGVQVKLIRVVPNVQLSDYVNNDPLLADTIEADFDLSVMRDQQIVATHEVDTLRSVRSPEESDMTLAPVVDRANKVFQFDASGLPSYVAMDDQSANTVTPTPGDVSRSLALLTGDLVNVKNFGASGDGVTDDRTELHNANISSGAGYLYFPTGTYRVSSNLTLNSIVMGPNTKFTIDNTVTLTITGRILASYTQIFDGDGDVLITGERPVYAEWFGAVANNVVDCADAIEKACNCQGDLTGWVQLRAGTYRTTRGIVSNSRGIKFIGAGFTNTIITCTSAVAFDLLFVSRGNRVEIAHLKFVPGVTKTAGSCIYVTSDGIVINPFTYIHNVDCSLGFRGIVFDQSNTFRVENCRFTNNIDSAITISNEVDDDAGDSTITGCTFNNTNLSGTIGVRQHSSGGLKISDCKFLGFETQYHLNLLDVVHTGQLLFSNNSMEGFSQYAIRLNRETGLNASWRSVAVTGNIFGLAVSSGCIIVTNASPGVQWIQNIEIVGNIFHNIGDTISGCVAVDFFVGDAITVYGNVFFASAVSSNSHGIRSAAPVTNGRAGGNTYVNVTVPFLTASTSFIHEPLTLYGTKTWDIGSVAGGGISETTVTVTGAKPGDPCTASHATISTADLLFSASVSANDTVNVIAYNPTGGIIAPASGTLNVLVHRILDI